MAAVGRGSGHNIPEVRNHFTSHAHLVSLAAEAIEDDDEETEDEEIIEDGTSSTVADNSKTETHISLG